MGLGYVGLPLAVRFSKVYHTIGLDNNAKKIAELKVGHDSMREVTSEELAESNLEYTTDATKLRDADIIIVAVPTPVDDHNIPDLTPVIKATESVAKHCKSGVIIVFESTVYPGVTEDICAPLIEKASTTERPLKFNETFFLGYSPERVNPGDKEHTIERIIKIVSGSTPEVAQKLKEVYGSIVHAGIHVAPSIRVAEAAKVIENVQRDINIALVNELAMLFERLGINVHDVLAAAGTKWNFHNYTPGLVGGHCIGVDPYYLTYKAIEVNYHPNIILAGRRINDRMHSFYVKKVVQELNKKGIPTNNATIAILGLTFKENCSDARNSRTEHLIHELHNYGPRIVGIDPWLTASEISGFHAEPGTLSELSKLKPDAIIITVPHTEFTNIDLSQVPVIIDIKGRRSTAVIGKPKTQQRGH